jgi:hypothetical protein
VLRETLVVIRPEDERPAIFPLIICIPSLVLALVAFGQEYLATLRHGVARAQPSGTTVSPDSILVRQRAISIIGWTIGFFLAIWLLGFNIAVPLATFLYLKIGAQERWPIAVSLTTVAWLFFYGLFDYALHLPFPKGQLIHLVGI